ncbi:MAG: hypothetical protein LC659_15785, partial [Myxococcales bacterium]|nr:hypothetical protein [Myxococcales bacterium]
RDVQRKVAVFDHWQLEMLIDELLAWAACEHGALGEVLVHPDMGSIVEQRRLRLGGRPGEFADGGELDDAAVFAHVHLDFVVSTNRDICVPRARSAPVDAVDDVLRRKAEATWLTTTRLSKQLGFDDLGSST